MRVAVLTISDRGAKGERADVSGDLISSSMVETGAEVVFYSLVPDEQERISGKLIEWADSGKVDLILTTGGTGIGPRDVTPEATTKVIDRLVPGLAEAMRNESLKHTPHAMLSRAMSGTREKCLIVNLPGSPKAVRECLGVILPTLPHAVELLRGDITDCADSAQTR